jgi:hypothetical protein
MPMRFRPSILNGDLALFLCLLAIPLACALNRVFPYLYGDEYGVLGAAAALSGLEWRAPPMPYYGFLASIVTAPLYLLDLSPGLTYRLTLAVNALMLAGSGWLTLKLLRLVKMPGPAADPRSPLLIVLAAYTYPGVVHLSSLALGESVLLFVFTANAFLLARLLCADTSTNARSSLESALLGLSLGAAPFAHSRGLAFLIAGVIVLALAAWARRVRGLHLALITVFLSLSFGALARVKAHLLASFYGDIVASTSSGMDFAARAVQMVADPARIVELLRIAFGQLFYLTTSSYGIWLLGALLLVAVQQRFWTRALPRGGVRQGAGDAGLQLLLAYLLCSIVLLYSVSVLALAVPKRADHYFYGRYNEVLMPAVAVLALVAMARTNARHVRYAIVFAVCSVVAMALVVSRYPPEIFDMRIAYAQISGWFIHRQQDWKIDPIAIMYRVAACQMVLALLLLKSRRAFLAALVVFNAYISWYLFTQRHMEVDRLDPNWKEFAALEARLDGRLDGHSIRVAGGKPNRPMALQFALPASRVIYGSSSETPDALLDYTGRRCHPGRVVARVTGAALCYTLP